MKISYSWLKDYVRLDATPEAVAGLLTACGLEVEGLEQYQEVPGGLEGVVVGEVLRCEKHPDAGRLWLAEVSTGEDKTYQVVCGAPNVAEGQRVMLAKPGAFLPGPKGPVKIKKARIRGVLSEGMICAEDELGVGDSHEGILVLEPDTALGRAAAEHFGMQPDWVFEIGLTPNRIDAASHLGVARDLVAVLNHRAGKQALRLKHPSISAFSVEHTDRHIPVRIEDPAACPRYSGLTISGLKVEASPPWLRQRLLAIGAKPINNVVDVTNYVLHELGQPLHAFDADHIGGGQVVVRKSPRGTPFVTLDEEELSLSGQDLMICDADKPMCMAGILGGIGSGVTERTRNVFLESACFDPLHIRRSATRHGLQTDASFRFERGSDPEITVYALKRAALLIREVAGGTISSEVVDCYPGKQQARVIDLNLDQLASWIGKSIPAKELRGILRDLEFEVQENGKRHFRLTVPSYRVEVTRPADVMEEVLRIYGYNEVEIPDKQHASIVLAPKQDKEALRNNVSETLAARGFHEIMNNSLGKASHYELGHYDPKHCVRILNPLSQDLEVMRQTLLYGGLETVLYNQNRKQTDMKLFEFGKVYRKQKESLPVAENPLAAYQEREVLAFFMTGRQQPESWRGLDRPVDFFDLKASVMAVLNRFGLEESGLKHADGEVHPCLERGLALYAGTDLLARLGAVKTPLARHFELKQRLYYACLEWETVIRLAGQAEVRYREVPRFPEVRRDLALLVDQSVRFADIEQLAFKIADHRLQSLRLFDVYEDEKLGRNKKSYAIGFALLDESKTLTDQEIDLVMERLAKAFTDSLGAEIRA